jgi:hypothetical protein
VRNRLPVLRLTALVTLIFFCWSYLPLYQMAAYAATNAEKRAAEGSRRLQSDQKSKPDVKLEKLLEDIREKTAEAAEKAAKGEDTTAAVEALKARKTEIEAIDIELKKEFAATGEKLKAANLPKEVLNRHYKFVKNYEDNIAELKANVDAIEKAKTPAALKTEIAKAKKHLDKVRPPKKRASFDPNNLPNKTRTVKTPPVEAKKLEENKIKPVELRKKAGINNGRKTPILIASNGSLDGLLPNYSPIEDRLSVMSFPLMPDSPENVGELSAAQDNQHANLLLDTIFMQTAVSYVLTHTPPTAAELIETPDVQFTQAIKDLAAQHNHQPSKLFSWVYNNIDTVPTYGSIQGADMCLQTKLCNPFDTASLLIALFRASGVHAKYAYGTIQIEMDKIMKWLGVTDPRVAGTILATNGIPAKLLISGGEIKHVQMEHVWVNAWIDYIPSRGAVHKQGDTWIPLDPSIKFYDTTPGMDIKAAVPFDAQAFVNQIQSTATINETEGYVTNVNASLIQQTMQDYQTQVQNYLSQNHPDATVGDVLGKRTIKQINWRILPVTGMFIPIKVAWESPALPDNLRASLKISIPDPSGASNGLLYTASLPQIAGKKITLSFSPAAANDLKVIEAYLPKPHADGSPIEPSELPSSLPAYLVNLKPELRLDGQVMATGSSVIMGSALSFAMTLNEPGIGTSDIDNIIQAGEYYGIGLDAGGTGENALNAIGSKLAATKAKLDAKSYAGLAKDDLIGDLLHNTIASYFAELDAADELAAMTIGVIRYRAPSIGMFSLTVNVHNIFGIPANISSQGMLMDVDRVMQAVYSKDGNGAKVKQYMLASGTASSIKEHAVPEYLFSTTIKTARGISAAKAIQIAVSQGIPIYTITQANVNAALPQLLVDAAVKTNIQNAVNAGKIITVPKTNIAYNGWIGCGYIIIDPNTGAGAYMISGGASGGLLLIAIGSIISHFLVTEAAAAELGDTYITQAPAPVIQPPCRAYFHAEEFRGCIALVLGNNAFYEGVTAALMTGIGGFMFGLTVGYIVAIIVALLVLAVVGYILLNCRKTATHCDPDH